MLGQTCCEAALRSNVEDEVGLGRFVVVCFRWERARAEGMGGQSSATHAEETDEVVLAGSPGGLCGYGDFYETVGFELDRGFLDAVLEVDSELRV